MQNSAMPFINEATTEWQERRFHEKIMGKISEIKGGYNYLPDISENAYYVREWHENSLTDEEISEIFQRGITSEITAMVSRYGELAQTRGYGPILPVEFQNILVQRDVAEEVQAYIRYQGFAEQGQQILLSRGCHEEIMYYVSKHGLSLEGQRMLLARGDKQEICRHIQKHGLADKLLDQLFDELEKTEDYTFFNTFVAYHELPVEHQKRMLSCCSEDAIERYFERYGLWEEAHSDLINHCSTNLIIKYIKRHRFLSAEAEQLMVARSDSHQLLMAYVENWYAGNFKASDSIVSTMILALKTDYEAFAYVFLHMFHRDMSWYDEAVRSRKLIKTASNDEVKKILLEKGEGLDIDSLAEMFFMRDRQLFDWYIQMCKEKRFKRICY